jgi:hypothetical protein
MINTINRITGLNGNLERSRTVSQRWGSKNSETQVGKNACSVESGTETLS